MERLKTKQFYEVVFICLAAAGFIAWLTGIVLAGSEGKQFELFFLKTDDFFADITNVIGYAGNRNTYNETYYLGFEERAYPPISYMIAYFLSRIVDMNPYYEQDYFLNMYQDTHMLIILIILIMINMAALYELVRSCKNGNHWVKIFSAAAFCLSMPMLFTIERANYMLLTIFLVIFYIFNYDSENKVRRELALAALGFASALKITPALLGILLLYNKQWKCAARAVIYGLVIGILPFAFFQDGFVNLGRMLRNASLNVESYPSTEGTTLVAALVSFGVNATDNMIKTVKIITYVIAVILLVEAVFYKEKWEMLMAVSMVLIIVPSHSGYYCILYIIPAAIAFFNAQEHSYWDLLILLSMVLIINDYQCYLTQNILNYHLGTLLIIGVLLVRGGRRVYASVQARLRKTVLIDK